MNIYNKLFVIAYVKNCHYSFFSNEKFWYINLSRAKFYFKHRDFDLYASARYENFNIGKAWYRYNKLKRLIGPDYIINNEPYYSYIL